ncbi:extracellular solute-binding protein [Paenibacillus lautus]|jgi:ABC-type glycerol-3-phosphate transport system substrate-binding protein|uniref:Extracellular solute-binding protein n=1 Tax=Paenibacillus lautus TaxID=1401 RepID=A0A385TJ17_PAELA|nr:extracellular solute-binding protein [Paenibacillus lautus]AYB42592.1 extracellular solute-binding protein [Paenibacillus lautus]MBY0163191.1 extracellular solute-binding protein [Cytobacillus firmus]MCI1778182.1 extracellular solute-binding protein [Paenibacillus lautus]
MRLRKKSLTTSMTALLAAALMLSACGGGGGTKTADPAPAGEGGTSTPPTEASDKFVLGETPLEFSFYGHYNEYTMPPWGQDESSKWIKENKKVTVNAIHSQGNAQQKFNTMIASTELPDVMWMDRGPDVEKLRQADMLVPFDEYLDKYPNLKEWMGDEGLNMLRSPDGKLYQFPNWYTNQPNGNAGYVVNKKIYKELGEPKLETTDDLYEYLKAVKAKYGDQVVPYEPHVQGQGIEVLYSAFAENALTRWISIRGVPNGDKLTSIFTDPIFRESMQYSAKLFREKLISQDAMTQTADQVKEKVNTGRVAVYAASSPTENAMNAHAELTAKDPEAGYFMIWPIHKEGLDKNKIFPGTYTQLGWNVSVITKSAKDPEAIFAFLDWYTGPEGQSVLMWGPPGGYWDGFEEDGVTPKFTEKYVTDAAGLGKLQAITTNLHWNGNTVFVDTAKAKYESTLPEEQRNWSTRWQYEITWKTQANATEYINLDPAPDSEEGIIRQRVEDIFTESRAKALYAKDDAEVLAILDKAEADAQAAGYDKLLAFKTTKWQENVAKMKGQ